MSSKTFLRSFLMGVFNLCLLVLGLNFYVNPYGYYGDKSLGGAYIVNAQVGKLNYLKGLEKKPDTYVLGSSNSMRMKPQTIDSLFGVKSFNYGVYQASIEDFYCISHVLIDNLKVKPKLFIICIDDWNFRNYGVARDIVFKGAQNRLAYKEDFSKYLLNYSSIKLFWSRLKTGLSADQVKISVGRLLKALKAKNFHRVSPKISDAFYDDGVRKKYTNGDGIDITDLAESGKYDLSSILKKGHKESLKKNKKGFFIGSHEDFESFQPERIQLLIKLVEYLNNNNVKIIFNIMPIQPYYKEVVISHSNYNERMQDLKNKLLLLKKNHENVLLIVDNSSIDKFNGFENHFFDHIHPTKVNSDLMLINIKKQLPKNAIQ